MAVENLQVTVSVCYISVSFPFLHRFSSNGGSPSSRIWFFELVRRTPVSFENRWLCAWIVKVSF